MALVTVQRSPSPSDSPESDDGEEGDPGDEQASLKSPGRQRRSKSALKRLKKFFHTVRFISKLRPCVSESYFAVKGAALILPQSDCGDYTFTQKITRQRHATQGAVTGDIQSHLQAMFYLLRSQDTIKVAVKLESVHPTHNRYMAVVSCLGKQDTEESVILGIDCNETATIGLVIPIWADTAVNLNGDGGFVVCSESKENIFKPVSVQAMWSALQSLNKVVKVARDNMYIPPGLTHTWVGYYKSRITSERSCITEWFTSEDLDEMRLNPIKFDKTGDPDQNLQNVIKSELKQIMMRVDLDEVTSVFLRQTLEIKLQMSLKKYKSFVDQEMMTILGQLDAPSLIKDYLYLGSEWNASNLEELTENGVDHILNISREVDNFFPEVLKYMNVKEWDNEEADLFKHWNNTFEFIAKARKENSKVLVHCRMGISRSSSTVMAYLMKAYNMSRQEAFDYVKAIRPCVMPNSAFWKQLETYDGILNASRRRMIFKSKSEQNLTHQVPAKETEKDEIQPSEEVKFMKDDLYLPFISKHHDNDESVFLCDDPSIGTDALMFDIENSSRSADSTEESVDIPSPKADSWKSPLYGVYHRDDKSSTGDAPETDSSNGSDVEEDSEVKSITASAKNDLTPVEAGPAQLMSTSVGKYKDDSSWIKEATEVTQQSESLQTDLPVTCQSAEKVDGADIKTTDTCASVQVSESADSGEETVTTSTGEVELGVSQHYVKEKIPWNPGTVKKQMQGFEEKSKETKAVVSIGDDSGPVLMLDGEVLTNVPDVTDTGSLQVESTESKDIEMKDCEKGDQRRPSSVYDMEDIPLPVGIVKKTTKEIEDRNKQSDSSPESPSKPLQRSSSLKERITSKRKRESERRKTCMPILSPSAPTSSESSPSPTKEFVFPPKSTEVSMETDTADVPKTEGEGRVTDDKCFGENDDIAVYKFGKEEITVEKGIVKKQKMGIEQKSRDGRESQITTPSSDGEKDVVSGSSRDSITEDSEKLINKMDSSCALGSASSVPTDKSVLSTETTAGSTQSAKQKTVVETVNIEKSSLTETQDLHTEHSNEDLLKTDKTANSDENVSIATSMSGSPSGAKSTITKESSPLSPTSPPSTKKKKREGSDSRFDAETLELIREIGAAFLNSPEKTGLDKEAEEQRAEEGGSLVKFLVRNIEKNTATAKKKHLKEIIIIDKETQEKKKKVWKFQSDSESAGATTGTKAVESKQKANLENSLSSPALVVPKSETDGKDVKQAVDTVTESASDNVSNTQSQVMAPDKPDPDHATEELDQTESENKDKVKNLVGKFELSDRPACPKPSVPSVANKETKMLIIEQSSEDKSDLKSIEAAVAKETKEEVSSCDVNKVSKEMSERSRDLKSDQFSELRNLRRNLHKPGTRPKSAEPVCGSTFHKQMKSSHAHTLPSAAEPSFSWDGKKVRKLHGKTHPLAKLETNRKHPFYNTM